MRRTLRVLIVLPSDDPGGSVDRGRGRTRRLLGGIPLVRMPPKLCSNVLDACPSTPSTGPLPGSPMPASRTAAVGSAGTEAWFSATTRCADETVFPSQRTFGWTRHLTHMHSQTHAHTHTRTHTCPHPRMHQPAAFNTQHCKAAIATLRRESIAYPDYCPSTTLAEFR